MCMCMFMYNVHVMYGEERDRRREGRNMILYMYMYIVHWYMCKLHVLVYLLQGTLFNAFAVGEVVLTYMYIHDCTVL